MDEIAGYSYLGNFPWERWHANDTAQRFFEGDPQDPTSLFDGAGRLEGVRTVVATGAYAGNVKTDFRYGHDRLGHRVFEQRLHEPKTGAPETYRTRAVGYDLLDRVTSWREGFLAPNPIAPTVTDPPDQVSVQEDGESWTLDPTGNWTSHMPDLTPPADVYTPNHLNQYSELRIDDDPAQAKALTFDWLGQLRSDERRQQRYVWDAFGRLTKVLDWAGNPIVTYRFDAFNRRVEKTVSPSRALYDEGVVRYIYDGLRMIEERAVLGTSPGEFEQVRARFGFGNGLDEVLWMDRDLVLDGLGELDPQGATNGTIDARLFVHQDALGSAVAVTGFRPTSSHDVPVWERFTYSAYGEVTTWDGTWNASTGAYPDQFPDHLSSTGLPFLFTGQRYDAETGLHYYKNRVYDPKLGRFVSRDPLGYFDGPAPYQYGHGAPLQNRDPLGLTAAERHDYQYTFLDLKPMRGCGRSVYCMSGVDRLPPDMGLEAGKRISQGLDTYKVAQALVRAEWRVMNQDGEPVTADDVTTEAEKVVVKALENIATRMDDVLTSWFKEGFGEKGIDIAGAIRDGAIPTVKIENLSDVEKRIGVAFTDEEKAGHCKDACYWSKAGKTGILVNPKWQGDTKDVEHLIVHELGHWMVDLTGINPEIPSGIYNKIYTSLQMDPRYRTKDKIEAYLAKLQAGHPNFVGFRETWMYQGRLFPE